ncbi:MAG: hypothetical protein IKM18_10495 [Clostridia bacterium]|nr:hypothetical protein [Clostridia bacterium]
MNFITKNKKIIIISASVMLALALMIGIGVAVGIAVHNSPKNVVKRISKTLSEVEANKYVCRIEYTLDGITLKGEYTLTVTESDGKKSAELSYKYDRLNAVGESDEFISEITGTLYAKGDDEVGELKDSAIVWENGVLPSKIPSLEINTDNFESFSAEAKDEVLSLEAVLKNGLPTESVSGAKITLSCNEKSSEIVTLTLEYTDAYGAKVSAVYTYVNENSK